MRYDQVTMTTDLVMAAQAEHYYDLLHEAEQVRMAKLATREPSAATNDTVSLLQRLRQWIGTPEAAPPTPTTKFGAV